MNKQVYVGLKAVYGTPMTRGAYNRLRGWDVPTDENPDDAGYLVEYVDGGKPNHPDYSGYISWSPADVFERAYKSTEGLSFGIAIEMLKQGHKVARAGWNGRGMWLVLVNGRKDVELQEGSVYQKATGLDKCEILPHIDMWTVNSEGRRAMLCGWVASQTDILSDDWYVLDATNGGV